MDLDEDFAASDERAKGVEGDDPGEAESRQLDMASGRSLEARYRFQEGHTNAVRRPLQVRDFL